MAGDWIPACKGLTRKREVVVIAAATGRSRHEVAGLLLDFWEWADGESVDGSIPGVSLSQLTSIIGADLVFWNSVVATGWLETHDSEGLIVPNFDRWLGNSAKSRLVETRRKQAYRSRDEVVPDLSQKKRDKNGTTEEKRREEKREEKTPRACDPPAPVPVQHAPYAATEPLSASEFADSAEDLAQAFASVSACPSRSIEKDPREVTPTMRDILTRAPASEIRDAINAPGRAKTEKLWQFARRWERPPARAAPENLSYSGLKKFAANGASHDTS
jgi:hypothetical protein